MAGRKKSPGNDEAKNEAGEDMELGQDVGDFPVAETIEEYYFELSPTAKRSDQELGDEEGSKTKGKKGRKKAA